MTHEYSVLIHEWINTKKQRLSLQINQAEQDKDKEVLAYCQGQLDELITLRNYMTDHIDLDTQTYFD